MVEVGSLSDGYDASREAGLGDALGVLVQAVSDAGQGDTAPTASAVRLAMKRLTYNGFDPRQLGFKRFRDFLQHAADAGVIEVHERPGDVLVTIHGATSTPTRRPRVRRDLWKAALDWSPKEVHYLDIETNRVATLPVDPVPLEPERFSTLRERLGAGDPRLIKVPTIDIQTQLRWMQQFVDGLDDRHLRSLLDGALRGDKPARLFAAVLRNEPPAQERWYGVLASHVLAHLQRWRETEPRLADIEVLAATGSGMSRAADAAMMSGGRSLVDAAGSIVEAVAAGQQSARTRRSQGSAETQLRALLHRAIDRMPEDELRQIRVPAGFLVEE